MQFWDQAGACDPRQVEPTASWHELRQWKSSLKGDASTLAFRYFSLVYSLFLFIDPIERKSWRHWVALAIVLPVFIALYIQVPRSTGRWRTFWLVLLFALGYLYIPFNQSAPGMFVYPMAMLPFLVRDGRKVIAILVVDLCLMWVEGRLLHLWLWTYGLAMFLVAVVTVSNLYYARQKETMQRLSLAQDEIENLAKVAERERIARDLHDVLGHTLTLVVLKLQIVEMLIASDPEAAKGEVREIQQTARKALAEVRETVQGYRTQGLPDEVSRAEYTLRAAGIAVELHGNAGEVGAAMGPEQEAVLSLALREATTNVVRHAQASRCEIRLEVSDRLVVLVVQDDGQSVSSVGGSHREGYGLRGMRERVESVRGEIEVESGRGTLVRVRLPIESRSKSAKTSLEGDSRVFVNDQTVFSGAMPDMDFPYLNHPDLEIKRS